MRTTMRLPPALMAELKKFAQATGRSMTEVVEDALRATLARRAPAKPRRVVLVTATGDGVHPGVDLDDTSALLDTMDRLE